MLVIWEEPEKEVLRNLIEYACKVNDVITFEVPNNTYYKEDAEKNFKNLCKLLNKTKEEIIKVYDNENFIDEVYLKLKDKENMFWSENIQELKSNMKDEAISEEELEIIQNSIIKVMIESILYLGTGKIIFNNNFKEIKKQLEKSIIKIVRRSKSSLSNKESNGDNCFDQYFLKISDEVKKVLLKQTKLYSMMFLNFPEDIAFYKGGYCWMYTISHEKIGMIYPHNEKEIRDLSDMGLKFVEEEDSCIIYEDYKL